MLQGRREKLILDFLQKPWQETKALKVESVWHDGDVRLALVTRGLV